MFLEMVSAASDPGLLSIEEMREAAGVSDGAHDERLMRMADDVAEMLARACGIAEVAGNPVTFRAETVRETIDVDLAGRSLWLARRPIVSVASVVRNDVEIDPDTYRVDAGGGRVWRSGSGFDVIWPCGTYVVTYEAGYADVPPALRQAAMRMLRSLWWRDGPDAREPGLRHERIDGVGERDYWIHADGEPLIPKDVLDALAPFRAGESW